ncbi:MAG: BREX-6 system adenine-specific DNA-methyltransferase PglX [Myxococcales bacterium]|nr:BREX-6 system adenine-specific DNA-methyltransferase PglX [Myxococcales bacterium]
MTMTSETKNHLSATIRSLRAYLIGDIVHPGDFGALHAAVETEYRWSVPVADAGLEEAARVRRGRLTSWIDEQLRAQSISSGKAKGGAARTGMDFLRDAEQQAATTWLHRMVLLRILETRGLWSLPVVSGGWKSPAYRDFRALAPALTRDDDTDGYRFLLQLVFDELAVELPGLFGTSGVAELIPIPPAVLRKLVETINDPALDGAWTDDLTLGWMYQFWNDPERERLDEKLDKRGKLEPHEIANKTQLFTERYMVDWLLQNSLGTLWLVMCKKQGWVADAESTGTLDRLEQRRVEWRQLRELGPEGGGVALTELMPLDTDLERRWAYWVPQPLPETMVQSAPDSIRDVKILDPAVGSGHFLVVVFDLLVAHYHEEARHRHEEGEARWSNRAIVERILEHNLAGIDLDPRAVQIAAASLWLKARATAPDARPRGLNLVAANLRLAGLPEDDPALVQLRVEVEKETGIPGKLTNQVVGALRGADFLGSLLKVDRAVDRALESFELQLGQRTALQQDLFLENPPEPSRTPMSSSAARATLLGRLETFLEQHTSGDDLGLRLRGEQLAAGVRFVRLLREGTYDLVVGNPPYQGTAKMADTRYVEQTYPLGKADLYAAFLLRGLELVRPGGTSAMVTMRNWMFIKQYSELRGFLLENHTLCAVGDLSWGAFRSMRDNPVAISVTMRGKSGSDAVAVAPTDPQERVRTQEEFAKKEAGLLCQAGRHTFDAAALQVVPEWPLVYWWDETMLRRYQSAPLIGDVAPGRLGVRTSDNTRFLRIPHEQINNANATSRTPLPSADYDWAPYIKGAQGRIWIEPLNSQLRWTNTGLEIKNKLQTAYGMSTQSPEFYFRQGVAFSMIGANFTARVHRYPSIFGDKGSSVFPDDLAGAVCAMNSRHARDILESLNPSISFQVGDVNRLPLFPIAAADQIFARIETAFGIHESHREPSVEFRCPGPSPWRYAQQWAQVAVDRPAGAPLPEYVEEWDPEAPSAHVSYALGVVLGRFDAHGGGVLDPRTADLSHALPHGMLFLDRTFTDTDLRDGLGHSACAPLHAAWADDGSQIDPKSGLREWLATGFFESVHKPLYENRPIHWPLSSAKKTFVVWVTIHRWTENTLRIVLADFLVPALTRIEGEIADVRAVRDGADSKSARAAEKQLDRLLKAKGELSQFIADVEQCADRGARPVDAACPPREQDARYHPDLDDGVMINAAALWPLLDPQWKDPKKWWKELAAAKEPKDYDWAHLARRYWPRRVDKKCQQDPSLAVAHGCFWRYHPARAWAWELRLQDEIGPEFRIEETPYRVLDNDPGDGGDGAHRRVWLRDHAAQAIAAIEKEALRRMGRGKNRRRVQQIHILETGLWTDHGEEMLALEWRLSQLQGAQCRILTPDEPHGRAAAGPAYAPPDKALQLLLGALRGLADDAYDADDDGPNGLPPDEDDEHDAESDEQEDET